MNIKQAAMAAAGAIALALAQPAHAQVMQNGNFQSVTGSSLGTFNGSNVYAGAAGWTTSGTGVLFSGAEGTPGGTEAAIFNGGNVAAGNTLSQTLSTTVGSTYTVTFDFGAYGGAGTEKLAANVFSGVNGPLLGGTTATATGHTPTALFQSYTFQFTALDSSSTLSFNDLGSNTNGIDGVMGGVRIDTPAPEPGTYAAFAFTGLGVMGLMLRARKARDGMTI